MPYEVKNVTGRINNLEPEMQTLDKRIKKRELDIEVLHISELDDEFLSQIEKTEYGVIDLSELEKRILNHELKKWQP